MKYTELLDFILSNRINISDDCFRVYMYLVAKAIKSDPDEVVSSLREVGVVCTRSSEVDYSTLKIPRVTWMRLVSYLTKAGFLRISSGSIIQVGELQEGQLVLYSTRASDKVTSEIAVAPVKDLAAQIAEARSKAAIVQAEKAVTHLASNCGKGFKKYVGGTPASRLFLFWKTRYHEVFKHPPLASNYKADCAGLIRLFNYFSQDESKAKDFLDFILSCWDRIVLFNKPRKPALNFVLTSSVLSRIDGQFNSVPNTTADRVDRVELQDAPDGGWGNV